MPELTMHAVLHVGIRLLLHMSPPATTSTMGRPNFLREFPVARVMAWHRHNRARAIAHQHIIRNPDGDFLAVHRD